MKLSAVLVYINGIINNVGDLVDNYEAIDFSPRQLVNMSFQDFEQFVMPAVYSEITTRQELGLSPIFFFDQNGNPAGGVSYTYDEALAILTRHWYDVLTSRNITDGPSYVGDAYQALYGTLIDRQRRDYVGSQLNLAKSAGDLNTLSDVNPSIFTPSSFYRNFSLFWTSIRELSDGRRHREGFNVQVATGNQEQDEQRFLLANEEILVDTLIFIYNAAEAESLTLENIRTERNSLEKLIIE